MIKYSGAGNTFVIILDSAIAADERPEWVKTICNPIYGISADGVLFLKKGYKKADFLWDFYNSDGSIAEMCGNAARCAALFVFDDLQFTEEKIVFSTMAGLIKAQKEAGQFKISMPAYQIKATQKPIQLNSGQVIYGFWVDTGVPHFVINKKQLGSMTEDKKILSEIRNHVDFGSSGTNVTLIDIKSEDDLEAITFERGVENFTLACGTGAIAAAVAASELNKGKIFFVNMPGGQLKVQLKEKFEVELMGPAKKIAEINWFHMSDYKKK